MECSSTVSPYNHSWEIASNSPTSLAIILCFSILRVPGDNHKCVSQNIDKLGLILRAILRSFLRSFWVTVNWTFPFPSCGRVAGCRVELVWLSCRVATLPSAPRYTLDPGRRSHSADALMVRRVVLRTADGAFESQLG